MDCVVPLLLSADLGRFDLLCDSIAHFYPSITNLFAIVRGDPPKARHPFIKWIKEEELLSRDWLAPTVEGWYRQQALKLIAHKLVTTDFYWCLDADCFFVRPFEPRFIIEDNRVGIHVYRKGDIDWWTTDAGQALDVPLKRMIHHYYDVTPNVFSRRAMIVTEQFFMMKFGSWQRALLERLPWTEYQLHYGLMEYLRLFTMFYFYDQFSYGNNIIWYRDDIKDVKQHVQRQMYKSHTGYISLIQSNQATPVHVYAEEVSQLWLDPSKQYDIPVL
jgi:hypothetical protein